MDYFIETKGLCEKINECRPLPILHVFPNAYAFHANYSKL